MPDQTSAILPFDFYRCRARGNPAHERAIESRRGESAGFTLIETMIVVAIIAILTTIAVPTMISYRIKAQNALAISEIKLLEQEIKLFEIENMRLPDSLSEVKLGNISDPWGNPYQYLKIAVDDNAENGNGNGGGKGSGSGKGKGGGSGKGKGGGNGGGNGNGNDGDLSDEDAANDENLDGKGKKAKPRKDHFMVPVNTDFDLYSMGQDGQSRAPFTAKASHDDIVRASDGKFIGLVSNF